MAATKLTSTPPSKISLSSGRTSSVSTPTSAEPLPTSTSRARRQRSIIGHRKLSGEPTFHAKHSVWSSNQGPEPCLAFDVTWDGPPAGNEFEDYAFTALLTQDIQPDDLALVIAQPLGMLTLVWVLEDGSWLDACRRRLTSRDGATILGRVICESSGLSDAQMREREASNEVDAAESAEAPQDDDEIKPFASSTLSTIENTRFEPHLSGSE